MAVDTTYIHYSNAKSFLKKEKKMCANLRSIPICNVIFGHIYLCIHVNNQAFNCTRINLNIGYTSHICTQDIIRLLHSITNK